MSDDANSESQRISRNLTAEQKVGGGRFRLIHAIGRGGMGVVWLARDERLSELVALKFLPPEICADPSSLEDLRREARKSRALTHPHIIRIHDVHEVEGEPPFIAMEYVEGSSLNVLCSQQAQRVLTWKFLEPLVVQLCEALEYAHGEKMIHRDLKPANLMLDTRGRLKLADFGIAATVSDTVSRISMRYLSSGTPSYMSPQQMSGSMPHVTDDVYSLGATLYDLLTGKPPFHSGDIPHQVRSVPAMPLENRMAEMGLDNPVPPQVAALIMACLSKEPAQRPQSAAEVKAWIKGELPRSKSNQSEVIIAPRRNMAAKFALIAGVATAVLAAVLGVAWWGKSHRQARPVPLKATPSGSNQMPMATSPVAMVKGQRLTNSLGMVFVPVPGTKVLFSIWETRVQDFEAFVNATKYVAGDSWKSPGFKQGPTHPVCGICWNDANTFCDWLTQKERSEGRLSTNQSYRLPTDAEWSWAVGIGDLEGTGTPAEKRERLPGVYPWGTQWPPPKGAGNFAGSEIMDGDMPADTRSIQGYRDDYPRTAPVGSFDPNQFGIYDLAGNVLEFCKDLFDNTDVRHVIRGSFWRGCYSQQFFSSRRIARRPNNRSVDYGFRCVLATGSVTNLVRQSETISPAAAQPAASPSHGAIGLGAWNSLVQYSNLVVIKNGTILYQSDFLHSGINGWHSIKGNWSVTNGVCQQTALDRACRMITGDASWSDYTITVRALKVGGSDGFVVLFNCLDDDNLIWWVIGGKHDTLKHTINGYRSDFGAKFTDSITTNQWYDLRVELKGTSLKCYLDGQLIHDIPDYRN